MSQYLKSPSYVQRYLKNKIKLVVQALIPMTLCIFYFLELKCGYRILPPFGDPSLPAC